MMHFREIRFVAEGEEESSPIYPNEQEVLGKLFAPDSVVLSFAQQFNIKTQECEAVMLRGGEIRTNVTLCIDCGNFLSFSLIFMVTVSPKKYCPHAPFDVLRILFENKLCHVRKEHIPEFHFDTVLDVGCWGEGFDLFADPLMVVCDPAMSVDQPVVQGMKMFPSLGF